MSLESFIRAYIECALWSSTDDADESGGEPLDANYDESDIAPEARQAMEDDCASFYNDPANRDDLDLWQHEFGSDSQAGHDFWLTRNGHGAGFWDRFYGDAEQVKAGDRLTKASKPYGEVHLYVGDDGRIYVG